MNYETWNPVEAYGKSRGGHTYNIIEKPNIFNLQDRLRRVLWEKNDEIPNLLPDTTQDRRDKRSYHNRLRKSAEDNA